jgi:hypothetical protein
MDRTCGRRAAMGLTFLRMGSHLGMQSRWGDGQKLEAWKDTGMNRLSFGLQTDEPGLLAVPGTNPFL